MITLKELLESKLDSVRIFSESPMRISDWDPDQLSGVGNNFTFTVGLKEKGKYIEEFENYKIYTYTYGKDIIDCIVDGNFVVSYFQYVVNDDVIEMNRIWQDALHIGLVRKFILQYYLKKYSTFLTDNTHTEFGERCVKKLIFQAMDEGYRIFVLVNDKEKVDIYNVDDIDKYYSDKIDGLKHRIGITK
jgi:hypothetical protein